MVRGGKGDRFAVATIAVLMFAEPVVQPFQIGTWRAGLFALNLLAFLLLWRLSERFDRWWIIIAASAQLLIVVSHLLPLMAPGQYNWTLATLRLFLWTIVALACVLGVYETRSSPKAA